MLSKAKLRERGVSIIQIVLAKVLFQYTKIEQLQWDIRNVFQHDERMCVCVCACVCVCLSKHCS